MKLHFEQLDYQQRAAKSIVGVFANCEFAQNTLAPAQGNPICNYAGTQQSINAIRKTNGVENDGKVVRYRPDEPLNLDVVMETGTGKTFTFIDTIYRLNRAYGLSKFIILVPSNAIRAGAMKNLNITREFFAGYGAGLAAYDYNESAVANFIGASNKIINVLVTSFASFNSVNRIINKKQLERNFFGKAHTYMEAIAGLRPVIIIDEPHRAGGDKTKKYLPNFNAQITLRYGATFKDEYRNLMYAMDSATAFRRNLVKSITVSGVSLTSDDTLKYHRQNGEGIITYNSTSDSRENSQAEPVKPGDNLGEVFGSANLNRYVIEKLNTKGAHFDNGYYLPINTPDSCSELRDEIRKQILNRTIQKHFAKERELFAHGIKALSLFFIDDVGAYLTNDQTDGELAKMFDELYAAELKKVLANKDISTEYRNYLQAARGKVRGGYFARSNKNADNEKEIDLILRDKEKLLSFDEPTRFIFSKWALREGWDNPNIFTLAKLAPSNSEITKLQQIGRGLRLPVNQEGRRLSDGESFSVLDVVVPGSETDFVRGIQQDIDGASLGAGANFFNNFRLIRCGICPHQRSANKIVEGLEELGLVSTNDNYESEVVEGPEKFAEIKNAITALAENADANAEQLIKFLTDLYETRGKIKIASTAKRYAAAKIRKDKFAEFKDAWQRINSEAIITYDVKTPELISKAAAAINEGLNIQPVHISISETQRAQFFADMITGKTEQREVEAVGANATLGEFMRQLSITTKLTRHTIAKILGEISADKFDTIKNNPKQAARDIADICKREINKLVLHKIGYDIVETNIKSTALTDDNGEPKSEINAYDMGRFLLKTAAIENNHARDKLLYDNALAHDSEIEKTTIEESGIDSIIVFAKLPKVRIKTPVGEYNPDFAFVVNNGKRGQLYLVVETKGYDNIEAGARASEKQKIKCAKRFFEALNNHAPNTGIDIQFRPKINAKP